MLHTSTFRPDQIAAALIQGRTVLISGSGHPRRIVNFKTGMPSDYDGSPVALEIYLEGGGTLNIHPDADGDYYLYSFILSID